MAKKTPTADTTTATSPQELGDLRREELALGREQARLVRRYLEALADDRPRNGRHSDPEFLRRKLERLDRTIPTVDVLARLQLVQQRLETVRELESAESPQEDVSDLEAAFVKVAKGYSERKKISWTAWRTVGVPADVLRKAGIKRVNERG